MQTYTKLIMLWHKHTEQYPWVEKGEKILLHVHKCGPRSSVFPTSSQLLNTSTLTRRVDF